MCKNIFIYNSFFDNIYYNIFFKRAFIIILNNLINIIFVKKKKKSIIHTNFIGRIKIKF